jgi:hypothetical protein
MTRRKLIKSPYPNIYKTMTLEQKKQTSTVDPKYIYIFFSDQDSDPALASTLISDSDCLYKKYIRVYLILKEFSTHI